MNQVLNLKFNRVFVFNLCLLDEIKLRNACYYKNVKLSNWNWNILELDNATRWRISCELCVEALIFFISSREFQDQLGRDKFSSKLKV